MTMFLNTDGSESGTPHHPPSSVRYPSDHWRNLVDNLVWQPEQVTVGGVAWIVTDESKEEGLGRQLEQVLVSFVTQ